MKLLIVKDNQVIRDLTDPVAECGDGSEAVVPHQEGSAINPTFPYKGATQLWLLPKLFFWESLPCY